MAPFLAQAAARSGGRFSLEYYAQGVASGELHLFLAMTEGAPEVRGAALAHLNDYPTGLRALQIVAAAGRGFDAKNFARAIGVLRAFAAYHECDIIEWFSRPGFARWAARLGGAQTNVTVEVTV